MEKGDFGKIHQLLVEIFTQIKNKLKINLIILDRGFIASKIVQILYSFNYSFIIAFRKSQKIVKVFKLLENPKTQNKNQFFISSLKNLIYRINSNCWVIKDYGYGNPSVKVNLIIWKVKKQKPRSKKISDLNYEYFLYITSPDVPSESVYDLYGTRWRIETAFRQIKSLQAKTRVIHPSHRIWLFAVACLMYSSWIYRHLPKDPDLILPENLITQELKLLYRVWQYSRVPVRELKEQYLQLLDKKQLFFL